MLIHYGIGSRQPEAGAFGFREFINKGIKDFVDCTSAIL
jgi:hypothetical protein